MIPHHWIAWMQPGKQGRWINRPVNTSICPKCYHRIRAVNIFHGQIVSPPPPPSPSPLSVPLAPSAARLTIITAQRVFLVHQFCSTINWTAGQYSIWPFTIDPTRLPCQSRPAERPCQINNVGFFVTETLFSLNIIPLILALLLSCYLFSCDIWQAFNVRWLLIVSTTKSIFTPTWLTPKTVKWSYLKHGSVCLFAS